MAGTSAGGGLDRQLNWVHGATVMAGYMIGAGIFVIAGQAANVMGPVVPLAFLGVVPLVIATALIYSMYMSGPLGEHAGGAYVHISRTWDSLFTGYIVMWGKWIAYPGALAAIGISLGTVLHSYTIFAGLSTQTWALVAITIFFVINIVGIDIFGNVQALLTIFLVLALVLLIVPGLFFIDTANFTPLFPQELYENGYIGPVLTGTALLLFSYLGFEAVAQAGEETKAPQQVLPKLFVYTSIGVGILYTLVTFVVIGTIGWQTAASVGTPLTAAAQTYFPTGTAVIIAFASILAYVSTLNASYLVPSRLMYAFGKDNIVPSIFAHVNDRFHTPDVSITTTYVVGVIFIITSTFQFAILIIVSSITIVFFTHSLSGIAFPWLRPELYDKSQFKLSPVLYTIIGGISAVTMAIFGWQTLSVRGLEPAVIMILRGNIAAGLTSNPAFTLIVWYIVGAVIFFSYRSYLRLRDAEIEDDRVIRRLYESD